MFSLDELDAALPAQMKGGITKEIVDNLNKAITDPEFARAFRDNAVSYTHVLKDGKFKLEDYMSAVVYVSYKLMGKSDKECYMLTFPDRYQALVARNATSKDIAAYVSSYNRGKLVNLIYEHSIIPTWVLNQDVRQQAINHQLFLMTNAKSEKVQTDAANSLLTHLKPPENVKVELDIGMSGNTRTEELFESMNKMVAQQQELLAKGIPTHLIASQAIKVVDHE